MALPHNRRMPNRPAIGPYRLEETLAESATVSVHRATRTGIEGFEKAVVLWRVAAASEAPEAVIARARQCGALRHSNIAQVLDAGVEGEGSYVATEYVAGASLAQVLHAGSVPWPLLLDIGAQVANGLDHAHTRRDAEGRLLHILHGSVSAHRVLLSTSGDVKLTGFGLPPPVPSTDLPDGRSDVRDLAVALERHMPIDAPEEVDAILSAAQRDLPEERPRAAALRHAFRRILHDRRQRASSLNIGRLVAASLVNPGAPVRQAPSPEARATTTPLDLETYVRELNPFADLEHALSAYEALGRRLVEARAGSRGLPLVIAGLDLAESVGRDDLAARMCLFLSQLAAQAGRLDESLEWRARAAWSRAS